MSSVSLKYLLKSKSFKFMRDRKDKSHSLQSFRYQGRDIYYRSNTSDMTLIYEILLKSKIVPMMNGKELKLLNNI